MGCSAADINLKFQYSVVSGASYLALRNIAHHKSVAVLHMPYKIGCNSMHPFYGDLAVPFVPVRA